MAFVFVSGGQILIDIDTKKMKKKIHKLSFKGNRLHSRLVYNICYIRNLLPRKPVVERHAVCRFLKN